MKQIAFIGIGVMGKSMVLNLMAKGYNVQVYNRTKEKTAEVVAKGAIFCASIKECVKGADFVISMVGYPSDVEDIYFASNGILENVEPKTYLIDMTTTSPKLAKKLFETAKSKNVYALDAPVSGGDIGAKNATLAIMVGGEKSAFDTCLPVLECMGTNIVYQGCAGSGQHVKMANQIVVAGTIAGVCEAVAYAKAVGVNCETLLSTISTGAASSWQLSNLGSKMSVEDFAPGFFIKHFVKDMKIVREEAESAGVDLAVLKKILEIYMQLEQDGCGELGTQAIIKNYIK